MAHTERAHAKLSASGAKRWLNCTPSAALEEHFEDKTSEYAEEGTLAHEIGEVRLRYKLGHYDISEYIKRYEHLTTDDPLSRHYSPEMDDYVDMYVDAVIERYHAMVAKCKDAIIIIERRLDLSRWVPESFGTSDVILIGDGLMEVIDLKYGKGVQVDAEDNPQMRLYGLGALDEFSDLYDIKEVSMTIIQPRLDHISTEVMTFEDLMEWGDDYVKPRAELADKGEGEYCAGDHCLWCKANARCEARAKHILAIEADYGKTPAGLLTTEQIADILGRIDELVKWAGAVKDYALEAAEQHGVRFPGWKLVEGRSNRVFTDKDAVASTLEVEGYDTAIIFKPRELKGITDMEKLVGKKNFEKLLGAYVDKPQGKPTLVPESDKRPGLNSTASAIKDFDDDPSDFFKSQMDREADRNAFHEAMMQEAKDSPFRGGKL